MTDAVRDELGNEQRRPSATTFSPGAVLAADYDAFLLSVNPFDPVVDHAFVDLIGRLRIVIVPRSCLAPRHIKGAPWLFYDAEQQQRASEAWDGSATLLPRVGSRPGEGGACGREARARLLRQLHRRERSVGPVDRRGAGAGRLHHRAEALDMRPGSDFVHAMHEATATAARTIAVLSPAYAASAFSEAEWRALRPRR